MNKEDLIKLKEKISKLTEQEQKLRDLHLRKLANGELQGPPVGYPSIDKPWLKYYSEFEVTSDVSHKRMYEEFKENCKKYSDNVAIEYFGNKITYNELLEKTEEVAKSLIKDGIKAGDKVTVSMPYLPETIYTIYALNKIGAVVNMVDPRINSELMTRYINNSNSDYVIIIDKIEKKILNIKDKTNLRKVISVSPMNSMGNIILKIAARFKKSDFTKWSEFIVKNGEEIETVPFKENELAVIEYTSGTSGEPKGVMLSNEAFNSLSYFQSQSCKMKVGSKFLLIMPPFIAYGLVIGMHNMLGQGQHLIMIPNFTLDKAPKMLPKLINKHHPNWIMGVPNFLQILMNYKKDLSCLDGIIIGGDHLETKIEENARKFLTSRGSKAKIYKGWGMTELASCGSFTKIDAVNNVGSVGIPLSKNNIKILPKKNEEEKDYNIDNLELTYGEEGVLFMSSPALTLGYYNNEKATNDVIYIDSSGTKWMNTGDIFRIANDGSMYFNRREKRVVVRPDGHNIPTDQIEKIGSSFEEVENSVVVGTPCQKYEHGHYASLCISLNDKNMSSEKIEKLLRDIENKCNEELQPRDRAKYYIVINEIPYTMNAKVDYDGLMKEVNQKIKEQKINEDSKETFYIILDKINNKKQNDNIKRRIRKRK